jgi:hypothetical protein
MSLPTSLKRSGQRDQRKAGREKDDDYSDVD